MKKNICIFLKEFDIEVTQKKTGAKLFTVRYFKQVKDHLTYVEASKEFGQCVFHALACDSKLDNTGA